jgi:hypothetical protein
MPPNTLQTLKNLDNVLGKSTNMLNQNTTVLSVPVSHKNAQPTQLAQSAQNTNNFNYDMFLDNYNKTKNNNNEKLDYLQFSEVVNGRCATVGLIAGKIIYDQTGHDMYTQIFIDPESNMFIALGLWFLMSSVSLATFQKYNHNNTLEFFERSFGQYNMLVWLVNLMMLINHDVK